MDKTSSLNPEAPSARSRFCIMLAHNTSWFLMMHPFKGSGRLRELVSLLVPTPDGPTVIPTNYSFDILVDPVIDKGLERSLYYHGTYEAGTLNIMKMCLRKGDSFIDVGSNIGLMTLFASTVIGDGGTVYSFEPQPEIFAILKRNIHINKRNNVLAYNIALGSGINTATIYSNLEASRGSASLIKPSQEDFIGKNVPVQPLDDFVAANAVSNIRMMKVDVEGWELEVLKGASHLLSSLEAPIICVEYSNLHPLQEGQLMDIYKYILEINKYGVYKLEKGKEIISGLVRIEDIAGLPYHDNLFCFLPSHLKDLPVDMF